jgi:hypothetical protein
MSQTILKKLQSVYPKMKNFMLISKELKKGQKAYIETLSTKTFY